MRNYWLRKRNQRAGQITLIVLAVFVLVAAFALAGIVYQHSYAAALGQEKVYPVYAMAEVLPRQSEKLVDRRTSPLVPFVIYGSPALDVAKIDPASLSVSGASVMKRGNGKLKTSMRDLNGDGQLDLIFYVWSKDMKLDLGDAKAIVSAATFEGIPVYSYTPFKFADSTPQVDEKAEFAREAQNSIRTSGTATLFHESSAPPAITPDTAVYSNPANITIQSQNPAPTAASPYPSVINVNNFTGGRVIGSLAVTINGFNHGFPDDVDMLLCAPDNTCMIIWSDVGGGNCVGTASNKPTCANPAVTITLDDGASANLPDATLLSSGTFKPTNITAGDSFIPQTPAGATSPPPGPYADAANGATLRGTFGGKNPNGNWGLYVVDDTFGDNGNITAGWTLAITPANQFNNPARIAINDSATPPTKAAPYPSTITVAGLPTAGLSKLTVNLNSLSHNFPDDIDILLVGPTGANAIIMSDVGGSVCVGQDSNNAGCAQPAVNLTLDDNAAAALPDNPSTPPGLVSGVFQPTNVGAGDTFPAPAPAPSGGSALSIFQGTNPNGTWSLYVVDDQNGDSGAITNGWGLNFFTPTAADSTINGRVTTPDGQPLEGVEVQLDGGSSLRAITDRNGYYQFTGIKTGAFYTVTPSRANYTFNPGDKSFSQTGSTTDATFTAQPIAQQTANSIDSAYFFVRQHYVDFLGREPDAQGLSYWAEQINRCGSDAGCINERRDAVSAAFFKSAEFQETGSYVYRLYRGTLGRQIDYQEFNADRHQVVGGATLEASKAAFADAFVQRAEFVQKYQGAASANDFVNALLQTMQQSAGVDLSNYRDALVAKYNAGGSLNESRSLVIRDAVEKAAFKDAVYNHSFVLMQYFGYLKRNPDQGGLDFWYNVLNNRETNNYLGMVCSFITSREYQERFASVVTHSNTECGR